MGANVIDVPKLTQTENLDECGEHYIAYIRLKDCHGNDYIYSDSPTYKYVIETPPWVATQLPDQNSARWDDR